MPNPGWYTKPGSPYELAWFDGEKWTEHTMPKQGGYAPEPPTGTNLYANEYIHLNPQTPAQPQRLSKKKATILGGTVILMIIVVIVAVGNLIFTSEANRIKHENDTVNSLSITQETEEDSSDSILPPEMFVIYEAWVKKST